LSASSNRRPRLRIGRFKTTIRSKGSNTSGRERTGGRAEEAAVGRLRIEIRLLTVDLHGGELRQIPISGNARPAPIETGAIRKDGKLLLGLQWPDSWFLDPFVIDLDTGHATKIPIDAPGDDFTWLGPPMGKSWQPFRLCERRSGSFNRARENPTAH
jgi:hypothetical protein